jgi:predicted ferric reductase
MTTGSLWADRPHRRPTDEAPAHGSTPARVAARAERRLRVRTGRRPARQRPMVVDLLAALAGLGLGAVIALGIGDETAGSLAMPGGWFTAAGRITGLVAAYAMVVVVVLIARFPPLERAIGQDRLVRWHRKLGPYPLYLLAAHGILITVGYAKAANDGVIHQFGQLLWTYPGVLAATVGGVALIAAGVTSYKKARRKMAYETWWSVHLYTYLALFLSFSHQTDTGASFVGHTTATAIWTALWVGTLALVVVSRLGLPVWRSLRHRVRVHSVERVAPDAVTITLRGRKLDRLPVAGGQFMQWRFLRRGLWWQAHPYSLSHVPTHNELRITVKDLGDHSGGLASIPIGTAVAMEGPYGAFTADTAKTDKVLLVGAGVGTAPIRALLPEFPAKTDIAVLLRAHDPSHLLLRDEIAGDLQIRGGVLHELVGPRDRVRTDAAALLALVPDLRRRDVYLCGPEGFMTAFNAQLRRAGVPEAQIHHESFAL